MDKKVETLKAHPAAEATRVMDDDEFSGLVESIKANGLRDPITVGVIGADRWIIDGRHREKACKIAGVHPEYEEIEFESEDDLIAFVDDREERRHITKGQKAMRYALNHPVAGKAHRGKKSEDTKVLAAKTFSGALLSQARTINAYSPKLARHVRDGTLTISEAFTKADIEKKQVESADARLGRLREKAADLAAFVDEVRMTLAEAEAALHAREEDARKAEASRRRTMIDLTQSAYSSVLAWAAEGFADDVSDRLADDEFRVELARMVRLDPTQIAELPRGLRALVDVLERLASGRNA